MPKATICLMFCYIFYGVLSPAYSEVKDSVLNSDRASFEGLFRQDARLLGTNENLERLILIRGLTQEARNLEQSCEGRNKINYASDWMEQLVVHTVLANFQAMGMELVSQAMMKYLNNYDNSDIEIFANNLVGSFCSKNISFISQKSFIGWFLDQKSRASVSNISGARGQSEWNLPNFSPDCDSCKENEFSILVKLFRSFCSWGGVPRDSRLLGPLIRNPVIYIALVKRMLNVEFGWHEEENSIYVKKGDSANGTTILCRDLICRKVSNRNFLENIPRSIGSIDIGDDLKNIYCKYFKNAQLPKSHTSSVIDLWLKEMDESEKGYQQSMFISLLTGIPDPILLSGGSKTETDLLMVSLNELWKQWFLDELKKHADDLSFEEIVTIETVDRRLFFKMDKPIFKVMFDVNMGEVDRINQVIGKLNISFDLKISKKILKWMRIQWGLYDPALMRPQYSRKRIIELLTGVIHDQVEDFKSRLWVPPWRDGLDTLIARELMEQVAMYTGKYFTKDLKDEVNVKVTLNYAPFALKYIRHKYLTASQPEKKL